ncbi:guanylate kinase [Nitratireductor aquibiodomus RA22]|uniref:Guanylate kinase n=1 Tax=Nitratireductor aquibiodomus RA22 TaxID=1189611 RepID=I5C3D6_9HYPH|nr:guanylate kinase [Nitratireductor aquibiodomus RA22]
MSSETSPAALTDVARRGLMLVLSSPSGAGKSTIARTLLAQVPGFELSVSVTTRARRGSEIEGVHYHFKSQREFEIMRDNDELLEWAEVHGNFYGTPRAPVEKALTEGRDMLFDIDWQGAEQLREKMRGDVVSIFILPPTMKELLGRLTTLAEGIRGTQEIIQTQSQERAHRDREVDRLRLRGHQRTARPGLFGRPLHCRGGASAPRPASRPV